MEPLSQFSILNSQFPTPNSLHVSHESQVLFIRVIQVIRGATFSIPNSQFSILNSLHVSHESQVLFIRVIQVIRGASFSILNSQFSIPKTWCIKKPRRPKSTGQPEQKRRNVIWQPSLILKSQFSILNSQFSNLKSQFSNLNSQFSILKSQFSMSLGVRKASLFTPP